MFNNNLCVFIIISAFYFSLLYVYLTSYHYINHWFIKPLHMLMMMMMMMMMMNCFCGMVDRQKTFSLISSRDHCQRSSPSRISDTPQAGFEPAQKLCSSDNHYTTAPQKFNEDVRGEYCSALKTMRN